MAKMNQPLMAMTAKSLFVAKNIRLPVSWRQPGNQYPDAFRPGERMVAPTSPINLFREPSLNDYHVRTAQGIGDKFSAYIDGITKAICDAVDKWKDLTMITGIINGPVGMVLPGGFLGPNITSLILSTAPMNTDQEQKYSLAIAASIGQGWQNYQTALLGTLLYPSFAAVPSPMAPPTPNVTMPLIVYSSAGTAFLAPGQLAAMMTALLGDPTAMHAQALFDSIAKSFFIVAQLFMSTTTVQNVLGIGPVPAFAPPVVPVGPVVCGNTLPKTGVLV